MSDRAGAQRARLAGQALARLWASARRRLESDPTGWMAGAVSIPSPTEGERIEAEGLLGRPFRGARLAVRLADLDSALRAGPIGCSLPEWLVWLGGPLRDLPAERASRAARIGAAIAVLMAGSHGGEPWYDAWIGSIERSGLLARYDTDDQLDAVALAAVVLDRLPGPPIPRQRLAAEATGDPKTLEDGPVARLVLGALAAWSGADPPDDADATRALWEHFDVLTDDLSSQVIALGLRPTGSDPLEAWLRAAAGAGHPVVLTRRDVARALAFEPSDVFVCENPTVVQAAAFHLGVRCATLLCTNGRPHAAFWVLAERLRAVGSRLRYHGDFDPAGVDIAAGVMARLGAAPWRMSAADYVEGLARVDAPAWRGQVALKTPWDAALAREMSGRGAALFEEHVLEDLLTDLASTPMEARSGNP